MIEKPSRRDLLRTTGLTALAAATPNAHALLRPDPMAGGYLDGPNDSPLPDPTNDTKVYNSAKQYITQRFQKELLVKPIDYGLTLDGLRQQAPLKLAFLSRNVEQLAQQCASLLERGIATRSEYELVAEKDLVTLTDLAEFITRDAANQAEAQLGYFSIDSLSAKADEDAVNAFVSRVSGSQGNIKDSLQPEADSEQARTSYLQQHLQYEQNTIPTRRNRAQAIRQSYALKVLSYAQLNGPNNYPTRLDILANRFLLDFASAAARFPALYQGLREIYGYDKAQLPVASQSLFDNALIWLRNIAEFLVSFGMTDQGYTLPISVRHLVGEVTWLREFLTIPGQVSFTIGEDLFPQQRLVRIKGLSAYAVPLDSTSLYSVALQAPAMSFTRHMDGSKVPLNQAAPLTRIGRVQSRGSMRDADIVGAVTLNNMSPFGEWTLAVTDNFPASPKDSSQSPYRRKTTSLLQDLVIDLHLTVQQAK